MSGRNSGDLVDFDERNAGGGGGAADLGRVGAGLQVDQQGGVQAGGARVPERADLYILSTAHLDL